MCVPAMSPGSTANLSAISPTRDTLIRKGIVHAPEHGWLAFSIPGFQHYVSERQSAEN